MWCNLSCVKKKSTLLTPFSHSYGISTVQASNTVTHLFKPFFQSCGISSNATTTIDQLKSKPDTLETPSHKFNFFLSLGFTSQRLAKLFAMSPRSMRDDLSKIKSNVQELEDILNNREELVECLSNWHKISDCSQIKKNTALLVKKGMSNINIKRLLIKHPQALTVKSGDFYRRSSLLDRRGIPIDTSMYVYYTNVMVKTGEEYWEKRVKLLQSYGWDHRDITGAFMRQPNFMNLDRVNLTEKMEFFLSLGMNKHEISTYPALLLTNFVRIRKECKILDLLASKGLLSPKLGLGRALVKDFKERIVLKHKDRVPEVLSLFNGNDDFKSHKFPALKSWYEQKKEMSALDDDIEQEDEEVDEQAMVAREAGDNEKDYHRGRSPIKD